jgi:hypothetical protein
LPVSPDLQRAYMLSSQRQCTPDLPECVAVFKVSVTTIASRQRAGDWRLPRLRIVGNEVLISHSDLYETKQHKKSRPGCYDGRSRTMIENWAKSK